MDADNERIDLIIEDKRRTGGIGLAVAASILLHGSLLYWFRTAYHPAPRAASTPIARYVELIRQNPGQFTEAPGPAVDKAPMNAPLSNANRRASMPEPTGDKPTLRPGDGTSPIFTPPVRTGEPGPSRQPAPAGAQSAPATSSSLAPASPATHDPLALRVPKATVASAAINWGDAIRKAGVAASEAAGSGAPRADFGTFGGESGFTADTGPFSFESSWYNWGDYSQSMVNRIRSNWYSIMPQILFTGLKGVVTIRFTIHRDGRISDITVVEPSGVPPYDYAARKAIEMTSPLQPLPADFPSPTERVVAIFFYNTRPAE